MNLHITIVGYKVLFALTSKSEPRKDTLSHIHSLVVDAKGEIHFPSTCAKKECREVILRNFIEPHSPSPKLTLAKLRSTTVLMGRPVLELTLEELCARTGLSFTSSLEKEPRESEKKVEPARFDFRKSSK